MECPEACWIVDGLECLSDSLRTRAVADLQGAQYHRSEGPQLPLVLG